MCGGAFVQGSSRRLHGLLGLLSENRTKCYPICTFSLWHEKLGQWQKLIHCSQSTIIYSVEGFRRHGFVETWAPSVTQTNVSQNDLTHHRQLSSPFLVDLCFFLRVKMSNKKKNSEGGGLLWCKAFSGLGGPLPKETVLNQIQSIIFSPMWPENGHFSRQKASNGALNHTWYFPSQFSKRLLDYVTTLPLILLLSTAHKNILCAF